MRKIIPKKYLEYGSFFFQGSEREVVENSLGFVI